MTPGFQEDQPCCLKLCSSGEDRQAPSSPVVSPGLGAVPYPRSCPTVGPCSWEPACPGRSQASPGLRAVPWGNPACHSGDSGPAIQEATASLSQDVASILAEVGPEPDVNCHRQMADGQMACVYQKSRGPFLRRPQISARSQFACSTQPTGACSILRRTATPRKPAYRVWPRRRLLLAFFLCILNVLEECLDRFFLIVKFLKKNPLHFHQSPLGGSQCSSPQIPLGP